ncbi:MAG: rhombotarget lipoprotein [Desulfobacterales bacterium]|nr:MAG: rhombotarget lipoprotein [Desulfobacterales bacterium]
MKSFRNYSLMLLILLVCVAFMGCAHQTKRHHSSSVYEYLYSDKEGHIESPSIPILSLPLRVGIAFVPETGGRHDTLTEKDKMDLMNEVAKHFKKYKFVKDIELIPSAYLTGKGSFANLDQIRTMYGVDAIALLSYDQTQFTEEGLASITYWTIVGAYIIPGEKNDTHTMVDAAVYDIQSRKMLFRAPGISHVKGLSTPINLDEELRADSIQGFKEASADVIKNLDMQLESFKEKVKEQPEEYKVVHKPGYTGGGSLDASVIILISILGAYWLWMKRKQKA